MPARVVTSRAPRPARPLRRSAADRTLTAAAARRQVGPAQQRRRRPAGRPPGRPGGSEDGDADGEHPAPGQRPDDRRAGRRLVEQLEQSRARRRGDEPADDDAEPGGRRGDRERLEGRGAGDPPASGAERAANADPPQAAVDLGPGRGGEHHAGRDQRDHREGDQQGYDDPGGLVEDQPDPRPGGQPEAAQAVALRARACSSVASRPLRVAQPDLDRVDALARRCVASRRRRRPGRHRPAAGRAGTRRCRGPPTGRRPARSRDSRFAQPCRPGSPMPGRATARRRPHRPPDPTSRPSTIA